MVHTHDLGRNNSGRFQGLQCGEPPMTMIGFQFQIKAEYRNYIVGSGNYGYSCSMEFTDDLHGFEDRKSTRLNSSHVKISYAVFCLKKKTDTTHSTYRT